MRFNMPNYSVQYDINIIFMIIYLNFIVLQPLSFIQVLTKLCLCLNVLYEV